MRKTNQRIKQSDQRICYSIFKTLIAKLAMRIIQIET